MKKLLIALLMLGSISTFAFECELSPGGKTIDFDLSKNGALLIQDSGYAYIMTTNGQGYVSLTIEGGPYDMMAELEAWGAKKLFLNLDERGGGNDSASIFCH